MIQAGTQSVFDPHRILLISHVQEVYIILPETDSLHYCPQTHYQGFQILLILEIP